MQIGKQCSLVIGYTFLLTIIGANAGAVGLMREGESDSADRIELASQLPTLTQQVAAASCALTSRVDVEEAYEVLRDATNKFDRYIVALRDGDESLHVLYPESNLSLLNDIAAVDAEWQSIHGAVDAVIENGFDVESAHVIDDHNLELLELTTILAADLKGVYARPYEISYADAMLIKITGRQRMLTQKMAKDACEIWTDYNAEAGREDLAATMANFGNTLQALRYGLPEVGIVAAPNDVIVADLDSLIARWAILEVNLQALVDGQEINEDQKYEIFHDLQLELEELEKLLDDYREHAERAH